MAYKHIMVAVDGSDTSNLALNEAIYLTISLQAHLYIVHVVDEFPAYNLQMGADFERCQEIVSKAGFAILDKAQQVAKKNKISSETKLIEIIDSNKKVAEKLLQAVKDNNIDLLILGTHGRHGFHRMMLGSVAEETVRLSPIPILLIRMKEAMS